MYYGVDPSLWRVREENEVHTAHARGATARPALAEGPDSGMQTRTRIQLPLVAKVAAAVEGRNESSRAGRIGLVVVLSLALGREVTVVGSAHPFAA